MEGEEEMDTAWTLVIVTNCTLTPALAAMRCLYSKLTCWNDVTEKPVRLDWNVCEQPGQGSIYQPWIAHCHLAGAAHYGRDGDDPDGGSGAAVTGVGAVGARRVGSPVSKKWAEIALPDR